MELTLHLTGTRALLVHNIRLANPLDPYAREVKRLSAKRNRTEDDLIEMSRVEFAGGLYHSDDLGPYVPSTWFHAALVKAGGLRRLGSHVKRAVVVAEDAGLEYDGPRDVDGLWRDGRFVDQRMVTVGQAKVLRTRPRFTDWAVAFPVLVDTTGIDPEAFAEVAKIAGDLIGMGDYRPVFGRFSVTASIVNAGAL